jgi:hypothetical protein
LEEHISDQDIERYRQRAMEPAALINTNEHLSVCEYCYQRFNKEDLLEPAYIFARSILPNRDASAEKHLLYDQIAAYVDEDLSYKEMEKAELHLENCAQCRIDVEDLRAVKTAILSQKEIVPLPAPPVSVFSQPQYLFSQTLQYAAPIAAVILVAWIVVIPVRRDMAELQVQLSQLRQENQTLQQQYDTANSTIAEMNENLTRMSLAENVSNYASKNTLKLKDGARTIELDKEGNLHGLDALSPAQHQTIKDALTAERVKVPPIIAKLAGNPKVLMGQSGRFDYFDSLSPAGIVVMTDKPTFRWKRLDGAESYSVVVLDSNAEEVAASGPLPSTEWSLPTPLVPGRVYVWQVRAIKNGEEIRMPSPSEPDAKFKVLDRARTEDLLNAKKAYPDSHLVLGILYAQSGLIDNAEQEFESLIRVNPKSNIAQKLLASLRSYRR